MSNVVVGQIFGNLIVTEQSPISKRTKKQESRWYCNCNACGDTVHLYESLLTTGIATSCGAHCGIPPLARNSPPRGTSGGPHVAEYSTWRRMWNRVYNKQEKDYGYYGFKGVTIHPSWADFEAFLNDVGKRPVTHDANGKLEEYSLDRIGAMTGNINYEPGNCKWATQSQQNNNKSNNRPLIMYNGKLTHYTKIAEDKGIHRSTLAKRIDKHGIDKALEL